MNDTVGYVARYTLGSSCQYDGYLRSTDGTYNNTDFVTDTGPTSAVKIVNSLPIGNYYIAMTTGWGFVVGHLHPPLDVGISETPSGEWFGLFL